MWWAGAAPRDGSRGLERDTDGDGLTGATDSCPDDAEDLDRYADDDGCPDCDHDVEWMLCWFEDGRGTCPGATAADPDGDQLVEGVDQCPQITEDRDGFDDADGCPEPDNDSDCTPDEHDRCPDSAGKSSAQGCPRTARRAGPVGASSPPLL